MDGIGGLLSALQRGRDEGCQRDGGQSRSHLSSLLDAPLVEYYPWCPPSQDALGICLRAAMANQQHGGHEPSVEPDARTENPSHGHEFAPARVAHNDPMIGGIGLYGGPGSVDIGAAAEWEALPAEARLQRLLELRARAREDSGSFIWIGLYAPSPDEFAVVQEAFDLPRLLVDDAMNPAHRPEIELDAQGHGLAVLKVLHYVEASSDVLTGQVSAFIGEQYAVTIRFGDTYDLAPLRQQLHNDEHLRALGSISVLYLLLDDVVDGYLRVAQEVGTDVEELEAAVFQQDARQTNANRIYLLKREVLEVRRAVNPLLVDAHAFVADTCEWVPEGLHPNFRDIGEHLLRANDTTESVDSLLMTMLMASMALQDLQQNRDMRKISAWVAIAAVPTMVAGLYGMNFENMPELRQDWGYPAVLAFLAVACGLLYRAFKRSGWL